MYGIFRLQKIKGASAISAMEHHNDRLWRSRSAEIDPRRSANNVELVNRFGESYGETVDRMIADRYKGMRAVRKDAVRLVEGIVTASPEFFATKDESATLAWFEMVLTWIETEFGHDNLVHATVHLDEATPHLHFGFVPLTEDGRLSAKDWMGSKQALRDLQDRFWARCGRGWGLERGEPVEETKRYHKTDAEFKRDDIKELRAERDQMAAEAAERAQEVLCLREETQTLRRELSGLRGALETLTERCQTLVREMAEIAETIWHKRLGHVREWRESLERLPGNPIARRALDAGQPWRKDRHADKAEREVKRAVEEHRVSLADAIAEAREISEQLNRERHGGDRHRGWER